MDPYSPPLAKRRAIRLGISPSTIPTLTPVRPPRAGIGVRRAVGPGVRRTPSRCRDQSRSTHVATPNCRTRSAMTADGRAAEAWG